MSIDLTTEVVFPVSEAPKHIPGSPSQATVWRWVLNGVGGVKLESILIGGKRFTSAESIQRVLRSAYSRRPTATLRPSGHCNSGEREITAAERGCAQAGF